MQTNSRRSEFVSHDGLAVVSETTSAARVSRSHNRALHRLKSRPLYRTALVLSGGGITGFLFEIGILAAIEDAVKPRPFDGCFDQFVGTSAGAVVAALMANGASPRVIYDALYEDSESPFTFRVGDVYGTAASNVAQLVAQFTRPLVGAIGRAFTRGLRPGLATIVADFHRRCASTGKISRRYLIYSG